MYGQALKLIRQFHNIKQGQLANSISVSNSYLSEIESGKKEVTLDLLKKYSDYFNIPMSSLMLFSEKLEDNSIAERFRIRFTSRIKQIMEWVVAKDDHSGAKKI
jgi:transcriptional regulator with XRE-family HTH domain